MVPAAIEGRPEAAVVPQPEPEHEPEDAPELSLDDLRGAHRLCAGMILH